MKNKCVLVHKAEKLSIYYTQKSSTTGYTCTGIGLLAATLFQYSTVLEKLGNYKLKKTTSVAKVYLRGFRKG